MTTSELNRITIGSTFYLTEKRPCCFRVKDVMEVGIKDDGSLFISTLIERTPNRENYYVNSDIRQFTFTEAHNIEELKLEGLEPER